MKNPNWLLLPLIAVIITSCRKETTLSLDQQILSADKTSNATVPREAIPPTNLTIAQKKTIYWSELGNPTGRTIVIKLPRSISTFGGGDPDGGGNNGYQYSATFYYDYNWPAPNYYVSIFWNVPVGGGQITDANYSIGNWGSYISGSFASNPNSWISYQGNTITFNLTGIQNQPASIFGIGNTNSNIIDIQGWVQTTASGGITAGQATLKPRSTKVMQ